MDKGKADWSWLPARMPGVARLMKDKRRELGDAHVNECWKRGVVEGKPGWLFAWEGSISVGTPFDAEAIKLFVGLQAEGQNRPAMLLLAKPGAAHGA